MGLKMADSLLLPGLLVVKVKGNHLVRVGVKVEKGHPSLNKSYYRRASMPEISVKGMSCGHCVAAVTRALQSLPGVTQVQVDLASGRVTYQSQVRASREEVVQAVKAAGYEVAG